MAKPHKCRKKVSSSGLKYEHHSAAKQAVKKRSKTQSRISKDQVVDATAQINSEFAQVQFLYTQPTGRKIETAVPSGVPEANIQNLAAVMKSL